MSPATCQNKGCGRWLAILTKRQAWLTSGYLISLTRRNWPKGQRINRKLQEYTAWKRSGGDDWARRPDQHRLRPNGPRSTDSSRRSNAWPPGSLDGRADFLYEFIRFGFKQGWACLFGGVPQGAIARRYEFLYLSAIAVQIVLLATRLETLDEAKIILLYHVTGTLMEVFKTSVGSWIYPEPNLFRIGGVRFLRALPVSRLAAVQVSIHRPPSALVAGADECGDLRQFLRTPYVLYYLLMLRLALFALTALLFARMGPVQLLNCFGFGTRFQNR
jgi:Protein of unknown function (DUF817)